MAAFYFCESVLVHFAAGTFSAKVGTNGTRRGAMAFCALSVLDFLNVFINKINLLGRVEMDWFHQCWHGHCLC